MITDLNAFADYATQCLTESNDPAMFDRLREDVSYARAQLERALAAAMERVELPLERNYTNTVRILLTSKLYCT